MRDGVLRARRSCGKRAASALRDVAEAIELLGDLGVRLRAFELPQLLLDAVHDELLGRRVARELADLLDAIEQLLVDLDLRSAEHGRAFRGGFTGAPDDPSSRAPAECRNARGARPSSPRDRARRVRSVGWRA